MKFVLLACLLATALADKDAQTLVNTYEISEDGSYQAQLQTSNGIQAESNGISYPGSEPETGNYAMSGSYSYEWEGVQYTVTWTADENGYIAEGDHLPVAPSV